MGDGLNDLGSLFQSLQFCTAVIPGEGSESLDTRNISQLTAELSACSRTTAERTGAGPAAWQKASKEGVISSKLGNSDAC